MGSMLLLRLLVILPLLFCRLPGVAAEKPLPFELREGDRVVFLGDTLMEREQQYGWIELMLTTRFPERTVTFRNLGWSADTPAGDSRFGLSLLQAGHEPADEGWQQLLQQLEDAKPTVVFVGYGMASSFAGEAGLAKFKSDYEQLLAAIEKISPGVKFVLLGPIGREPWGSFPEGVRNHAPSLEPFDKTIQEISDQRNVRFVSLLKVRSMVSSRRMTESGIHLTGYGYHRVAEEIEKALGWARGGWSSSKNAKQVESLRQAIIRKNEWFFHRSRPANMAYIFGFRRGEQGRNAVEIPKFDPLIAAEEERIAQLRSLKPGVIVPEIPRRIGNLTARSTPQPHPSFEVAAGLEVSLWAENPLLNKPIQMNFDAQGRLWVASSELYPQIEPGQAATDKIIVLEDTTGAGRADKATVFADGLLIPTGVVPGDGGCYVAQSTELLFFKDTDGDGKADVKRTVLSGFGTEDAHHNLHTLRWGFDGRLYMVQSIYTRTDTETPHGVVRLKGGGIFRFDPRDQELEILFKGWVNAWGHQFDDFGQAFVTDGAGGAGINYGLPGASYVTAPKARRILGSVSPGSYPKFCGLEIIRSEHFPADWQGDMITCDFRAHRVVRFKISEQGAGYVTQEMPDVLRTTTDTFRPIDLAMGPDGALYVADWSNPIIQHGEVDFRDPRRDKEHGRIWRITVKDRPLLPKTDLTKLKNPALLDKLVSANGYEQEQARRVLIERGAAKVKRNSAAWQKKYQDENAQLQALWLSEALNAGELDVSTRALAVELLNAKDGRIRAAAVRVLANGIETIPNAAELLARSVADEHPRVRLETVRALGRIPTARAAELALTVLNQPMDTFLDYALWLTINELAEPWLAAVKAGAWQPEARPQQFEFALTAIEPAFTSEILGRFLGDQGVPRDGSGSWIELIGSAGGAKELRQLFDPLVRGEFSEAVALRVCRALNEAARLRNLRPDGDVGALGSLFKSDHERIRVAALPLAGAWQLRGLSAPLVEIAGTERVSAAERTAALAALRAMGGSDTVQRLQKLARATPSSEVRLATVLTLAQLDFAVALPELPGALKAEVPEPALAEFWRGLFSIRGVTTKLTAELPGLGLPPEVARVGARIAREQNRELALVQTFIQSAGLTLSDKQLSPAELLALAEEAVAQGDAFRGEEIYRRPELACVVCHAIGGAGGKLGPDLTSIGASAPPDYLVESLLYPNAKIKEGFHSATITTRDDLEFSGIIEKETDREIILRNAANQEVSVVKADITQRVNGGSLMPSGSVDTLLPEERLDLIKFLTVLGKPGEFDAAPGGVARLWRLYVTTSQKPHLGLDRVTRGDFTLPDWAPAFSLVNGDLTRAAADAALTVRGGARGSFVATQFQSAAGGNAKFQLVGQASQAWLNGVPVPVGAQFTVELKPGVNTLVLELDRANRPDRIKLSSSDVSFLTN